MKSLMTRRTTLKLHAYAPTLNPLTRQDPTLPPAEEAAPDPQDSFDWVGRMKESAGPTLMSVTSAVSTQFGGMGALSSLATAPGNYTLGAIRLLDAKRTVRGEQPDGSKGPLAIVAGGVGFAAAVTGLVASAKFGNSLPMLLVQLPAVAANVAAGLIDPQS